MWRKSLVVCLILSGSVSLAVTNATASLSVANVVTSSPTLKVLSFKEWKSDKSSEIKARFNKTEAEYLAKKNSNAKPADLNRLYNDLKMTKSRLDDIGELTVSDYFVGYLSHFKDKKAAFHAAAEKLDSGEVAELMAVYADSLLKTSGEGISTSPQSATSSSVGDTGK
jgi:hypothetical protein